LAILRALFRRRPAAKTFPAQADAGAARVKAIANGERRPEPKSGASKYSSTTAK
jgi:hypothetical protein